MLAGGENSTRNATRYRPNIRSHPLTPTSDKPARPWPPPYLLCTSPSFEGKNVTSSDLQASVSALELVWKKFKLEKVSLSRPISFKGWRRAFYKLNTGVNCFKRMSFYLLFTVVSILHKSLKSAVFNLNSKFENHI